MKQSNPPTAKENRALQDMIAGESLNALSLKLGKARGPLAARLLQAAIAMIRRLMKQP